MFIDDGELDLEWFTPEPGDPPPAAVAGQSVSWTEGTWNRVSGGVLHPAGCPNPGRVHSLHRPPTEGPAPTGSLIRSGNRRARHR